MKPIAMKCTQEQFDSIKDRIPLKIKNITSFETDEYLSNNYEGNYKVSNISNKHANNREVIEHFDGEYFLECCGVEQTWKGSDLQYKQGDSWVTFPFEIEIRKKPNLDADIEALQKKANELGMKLTILIE
jgi:hypothetical protein